MDIRIKSNTFCGKNKKIAWSEGLIDIQPFSAFIHTELFVGKNDSSLVDHSCIFNVLFYTEMSSKTREAPHDFS